MKYQTANSKKVLLFNILLLSLLIMTESSNLKNKLEKIEENAQKDRKISINNYKHSNSTSPEDPSPQSNTLILNEEMTKNDLQNQELYFKIVLIEPPSKCNFLNCGGLYGSCSEKRDACICSEGYVHAPYLTRSKIEYCRYQQKSQMVAFLLELFLVCGIGHFYSMRSMIAFLKLIYSLTSYFIYDYLSAKEDHAPELSFRKGLFMYLGYFVIGSFCVVHIYDLIMLSKNSYLDGFGIPLA